MLLVDLLRSQACIRVTLPNVEECRSLSLPRASSMNIQTGIRGFVSAMISLRGRRKKGRGGGGREKGKREGSACSKSLCFCITPTNFLVIRLRLLSIKCRYTRQSERKAEPCGYAEIYLICRELTLHKYLSKREILTSGQPEI